MNINEFWELIDVSLKKSNGDNETQLDTLVSELSTKSEEDILDFKRHIDELMSKSYTSDLWAAAYIINGGCGDDGFDYFRLYLIAQGKEVFEEALKDPESLATLHYANEEEGVLLELEELDYVAVDAYEEKTDKDDFYEKLGVTTEAPEIELDWDEDDQEKLKQKYPKLFARFFS